MSGGGAVGTAFVTVGTVGVIGLGNWVAAVCAVGSSLALDVVLISLRVMYLSFSVMGVLVCAAFQRVWTPLWCIRARMWHDVQTVCIMVAVCWLQDLQWDCLVDGFGCLVRRS